jgi:hypothetical protein
VIGRFIKATLRRDPDSLFQFVLCPQDEEPLDLLENLIALLRRQPKHLLDRYSSVALGNQMASRRLLVQLPSNRRLSKSWIRLAEAILTEAFF